MDARTDWKLDRDRRVELFRRGLLLCLNCREEKPLSDFYKTKWTEMEAASRDSLCKFCSRARRMQSYAVLRSAGRCVDCGAECGRARCDGCRKTHAATTLLGSAKARAAKAGVPFSVSKERVRAALSTGCCEVSGLPFEYKRSPTRGAMFFSPSIDRVRPELGYTDENIKVVCWGYNAAKGSGGHEDVVKLARAIVAAEPS